jgi:hypothetical protein
MILEVANLDVRTGLEEQFEAAFEKASTRPQKTTGNDSSLLYAACVVPGLHDRWTVS